MAGRSDASARLAQTAPVPDDGRWPPYAKGRRVGQCLETVLNEEWAHHGFCVRDLDKLWGREEPHSFTRGSLPQTPQGPG